MEAALGPDNPSTMAVRGNAAAGLWLAGDLEAALVLYREALVRDRRILGNNHPDTLTDASNMAGVLGDLGRHYEAVQIYQEVPPHPALSPCKRMPHP